MASDSFDYVIVGAGSAGCVLANRLSAKAGVRVLLLEAGREAKNPMIKVPIGFTRLMYDPRDTNVYKTDPEPHLGGRRITTPRGRVMGGCSAINGMVYMRGHRDDYDAWARKPGCAGWSYAELLPYFKKSEHLDGDADAAFHGKGGELNVTHCRTHYPISDAYIAAAESVGIARNDDLNGAKQEGIGYLQVNMKNGERWSAADAFLPAEIRKRPNLTIVTNALASRVVFEGKRAVAVEYRVSGGETKRASAAVEIVLSAGAFDTPKLLELSGVGRPDVLARLGVAIVHELAGVGENLQDHFQVAVQHGVRTSDVLSEDGKFPRVVWSVLKYVFTKGGALAFPAANIGAFVAAPGDPRPSLQLHFTPGAGGMDEKGNMVASKRPGVNSISCVLQPTSRGSVHASSADPKAPPAIVHNYLATEEDRRRTLEGFKLQRRIYAASPFAEWATEELQPGAAVQSDDEILAYCRAHGTSVYHPVGTARMGAKDDALAVVDADLRVHGIAGLRVVDASIFPDVISGNTHAPVVAVAERAAERILAR